MQRYVLAAMTFWFLGIIYALRIGFPLILTQMVYIPNVDVSSDTIEAGGELICPVDKNMYSRPANETSELDMVCKNGFWEIAIVSR